MKKILLLTVCLLTFGMQASVARSVEKSPVQEVVTDEYAELVKQYMTLGHAHENMCAMMTATYVQMKENLGLGEAQCKEMAHGITDLIYDDLVKASVDIYKKYFTLEDMKTLCEFMSTPVGQKFAKSNGAVSTEVMAAVGPMQGKIQKYVMEYLSKQR